jgi:hypothetical protein
MAYDQDDLHRGSIQAEFTARRAAGARPARWSKKKNKKTKMGWGFFHIKKRQRFT